MAIELRIEAHHKLTYSQNVMMVAQQTRRMLRDTVTEAPCDGEAHKVADLVGTVNAVRDDGRARTNVENIPQASRRWVVFPTRSKSGQYIDKVEKLKHAMDPTSIYVKNHTLAVQKDIADKILGVMLQPNGTFTVDTGGVLGGATEGKAPGGAIVALPAGNIIAAGGTGMTLDKLIASKEALALREFGLDDDDQMYCAIGPKQVTDLLKIADGDGNSLNAFQQLQLQSGKPTTLLGLTWIVTNRLPVDASGYRMCPIWSKRNIVAGIWQDVQGAIWNDTHADNTPYCRVDALIDVVRVEDGGVQVITCQEV